VTARRGQPWEPLEGDKRYEDHSQPTRPEPGGAPAEFVDTSDRNLPGEQLGDDEKRTHTDDRGDHQRAM
jgi:hypothetical protein